MQGFHLIKVSLKIARGRTFDVRDADGIQCWTMSQNSYRCFVTGETASKFRFAGILWAASDIMVEASPDPTPHTMSSTSDGTQPPRCMRYGKATMAGPITCERRCCEGGLADPGGAAGLAHC